jgi:hypothetical protein
MLIIVLLELETIAGRRARKDDTRTNERAQEENSEESRLLATRWRGLSVLRADSEP